MAFVIIQRNGQRMIHHCLLLLSEHTFSIPPTNGDREILDNVINNILAEKQPDGCLGEDSKETGSKLLDLPETREFIARQIPMILRNRKSTPSEHINNDLLDHTIQLNYSN